MSSQADQSDALDKWFEESYSQLRQLARARLRGSAKDVVLDTTALVHESFHPRMAQGVELRYFAGLSDDEIAGALCVSGRTVRRDWQEAQLFLAQALK